MKWFSMLFGTENKAQSKPNVSMGLDELSAVIDGKINHNVQNFAPELGRFYSQIHSATDKMQDKINLLGKAVPKEQVDFGLLKVAASHRDEAVRKLNAMLKEFKREVPIDLDAFVEFHNSCVSALNNANVKLTRSFNVFEQVFRQESASLMSDYKNMYKLLEDIGMDLKEKKMVLDPFNEMRNSVESVKNFLGEIGSTNLRIKNLNSELASLNNKAGSLKMEIENLVSSEGWKSFKDTLKDREFLVGDMKNAKGEIVETISSVERALKKYKNLPDVYGKAVIELYLQDPVTAAISDKNQTEIKKIMDFVATSIAEGKLAIDEKKRGRLLERIQEIKDGSLEFSIKRYETLQKRKHELDGKLEETDMEKVKGSLEIDLVRINGAISEIGSQIGKLTNANEHAYHEIDGVKVSLENSAQTALNQKIMLVIPDIDK
ncbi:MAG: hypothetical protein HY361_01155 [Candidatus Aenigmarchaeota archaeon]|nr:hypothetical protein [Candidatus Aenigmarchaeota archaeon]